MKWAAVSWMRQLILLEYVKKFAEMNIQIRSGMSGMGGVCRDGLKGMKNMADLPVRFQERMKELLGEEYQAFEASYDKEKVQGLRFSRLKIWNGIGSSEVNCSLEGGRGADTEKGTEDWMVRMAEQVAEHTGFSLRPIPWVKEGFYYESQDRPGKHPYHEAGLYYIQEPSAMAVVELLEPEPGELVLDLCAAPGGKSSHIASRLEGKGFLLSNEIHPARAKILSQNIERMGVRNCVVCNEEPAHLVPRFPQFFDKIVVDAPCSGEGMFRKDEKARAEWSEAHVKMCAARQGEILDHAAAMLKPGGRMVYSTCTFAPEENEGVIHRFLARHGEFQVEDRSHYEGFTAGKPQWAGYGQEGIVSDGQLKYTLRIMPHKLEGEGHFMAVLRKSGAAVREDSHMGEARRLKQEVLKDYQAFIRGTLANPKPFLKNEGYVLFGEQLYLTPGEMPDMAGLKVVRPGLHMGTLKKNRFEPSHGLALALRAEEVNAVCDLPSESSTLLKYLRGETLMPEECKAGGLDRGWVLICTDGFSLGWCKLAGGILKNHYPKGLRWN